MIILVLNQINPFTFNILILYPLNKGFLMFSGGIKWKHWPKMGKNFNIHGIVV